MIRSMLQKDPDERISIRDILDHRWLNAAPEAREPVFNAAEREQMVREFFYDEAEEFWRSWLSKNAKDRNL